MSDCPECKRLAAELAAVKAQLRQYTHPAESVGNESVVYRLVRAPDEAPPPQPAPGAQEGGR